jgi:hypothetical protein
VDLVAFRIREAKAELFATEPLEETERAWKATPTVGIILTGTTLPVITSFISIDVTLLVYK